MGSLNPVHRHELQADLRGESLAAAQRLVVAVVDGDDSETDIDLEGIAEGDVIVSVLEFDTGVPTDRTAEASVTEDDVIQLDTTDTTGNKLVVTYYDAP